MKLWVVIAGALFALPAAAQSPHNRGLPNDPVSVYERVCSFCHDDGQIAAPIIGDKAAWAPHLKKSREELYESVLKGVGHMPARRKRRDYTDEDLKGAIDYLLDQARD